MKKENFIVVVIVEVLVALIAMCLLFSDVGALIYPISLAIFSAVLAPFFIRLKKESNEEKRRKIRRNMVLVMLLPIFAAIATIVLVVIALMLMVA